VSNNLRHIIVTLHFIMGDDPSSDIKRPAAPFFLDRANALPQATAAQADYQEPTISTRYTRTKE
jgi:hypothetical protein